MATKHLYVRATVMRTTLAVIKELTSDEVLEHIDHQEAMFALLKTINTCVTDALAGKTEPYGPG